MGILGTDAHSGPRMMAMLCNPLVNARDVASLIEKQPGMYARVLRVANSSYYGQARTITTLDRALLLLGLDAIRGIAAAACLDRTVDCDSSSALVDLQALVRHSLATAAAAESLARIQHRALACDAFVAGLLHNLGVAVQIRVDTPGVHAMIEVRRTDAIREMRSLESEQAAVGHEECSAAIFEAWQLPDSLVAVARHHHDPLAAPEAHRELVALVNLGATLGLACGNTFELEPAPVERNLSAMTRLGLAEEDLNGVELELPQRLAELRRALLET
jgi:HD-like signal output (HDOD) protein